MGLVHAFAAGIQEMLLQSHAGEIVVFPAIPDDWQDMGFNQLRARGGFLISAEREGGQVQFVKAESTVGGLLEIVDPFGQTEFDCNLHYALEDGVLKVEMEAGDVAVFKIKQ